jgi:hypothetical protein
MKPDATFTGTFSVCHENIKLKYGTKSEAFYLGAIKQVEGCYPEANLR